ncbi:TetR/AcrR family transcriptional regulator [Noviherbaspirillum pedocola]|uniref:TetR/AcrR family transcriptional regulator n=1 Tax=Noviherbaspirillum pedocola TaxID=2801341 RepID=A0A934SM47_9BURK|nr:TetR/AcrR family transcriptional regulator [Noviherbaspirillum pedocola]MBK4733005.1 TetR/AcrR family transcriptional regulator [Noviherbaspirillum pedocola]
MAQNHFQLSVDITMGRPREFSHEEVVDSAVEAFWSNGYEALSTADLASAMGVAKSSLYNAFKSKQDVLLYALARYANMHSAAVRRLVDESDTVGALRQLLLNVAQCNDDGRGCLLVNTAAELGAKSVDVQTELKSGFMAMQKAFAAIIKSGVQAGTINFSCDADAVALTLVTGIAGMRVLAKGGYSAAELAPFIDLLVQQLTA